MGEQGRDQTCRALSMPPHKKWRLAPSGAKRKMKPLRRSPDVEPIDWTGRPSPANKRQRSAAKTEKRSETRLRQYLPLPPFPLF